MSQLSDVFIPICDLEIEEDVFEVAPGILLDSRSRPNPNSRLEKMVSKDEWDNAIQTKHWLVFETGEEGSLSGEECMNLVLLALWTVKPNRAQAQIRFTISKNNPTANFQRSRILDRMVWNSNDDHEAFSLSELQLASKYFRSFSNIYKQRGRLNNAMILTLNGCWSIYWQAALISHAAAVETMLTHSRKKITHSLSKAFACLTEHEKSDRLDAYYRFKKLYSLRSDAVHGRIHLLPRQDRLPSLSNFQCMLRKLWHTILNEPKTIIELEKSDADRKKFFESISNEFQVPNNTSHR